MSLTLIAIAAAAGIPTLTHRVQIDHGGTPIQAIYTARTELRARTLGAKTPNRMDMQRCQWTATIIVDRALAHSPALARTVSSERQFSGSQHGACSPAPQGSARDLAQHQAEIREHLVAVAEKDRAPLLAELEAVRNLAAN